MTPETAIDAYSDVDPSSLSRRIKRAGLDSGFDLVGIATVAPATHAREFEAWYAAGNYKPMAHIVENVPVRLNPALRYPWARSVIALGHQYSEQGASEPTETAQQELAKLTLRPHLPSKPGCDDLNPEGWRIRDSLARESSRALIARSPALGVWPWIARYERNANYHRINDGNVERFINRLPAAVGRPVRTQEIVEHGTFFERDLAYQAGLGWFGKNNMIIHPKLGSFFVLTSVFVDLDLPPDPLIADHCGSCTLCLDACPTGALNGPRNMIVEKCLTARSVDIGGVVPDEFLDHLPGHLSGCDICQNACPFNSIARGTPDQIGPAPERWSAVTIIDLMRCDETERLTLMSGSLLARIMPDTLKRNAVLVGARILRVTSGAPRREDLDHIAAQIHPSDLPLLTEALREQMRSPYEAVRAAATHALQFAA